MGTSNPELRELSSNHNQPIELSLPDVKRITDVREFMAKSKNFDGSVEKLTEFILGQEKQCQNVIKLLNEKVDQKKKSLLQVKDDMLELKRQLKMPDAAKNCVKVKVQFTDEIEITECDVDEALARYSLKMSSLFSGILELDSDMDYAKYLADVAIVNKDVVQNWFKREKLNKSKKSPNMERSM